LSLLAGELRGRSPSRIDRSVALVVPELGLGKTSAGPDWRYGDAFMKLVQAGKRPCIVLESRANDHAYLRARGIVELVQISNLG
jgi:hypothetical protein